MQLTRVVEAPRRRRRWPIVAVAMMVPLAAVWSVRPVRSVSRSYFTAHRIADAAAGYTKAMRYRATPYCPRTVEELGIEANDAWGHAYGLVCDGRSVAVISAGPDERFGTSDDVTGGAR